MGRVGFSPPRHAATWDQVAPLLAGGGTLEYEQARSLMRSIMDGELDEALLAAFLSIMAVRGVAVSELLGLADQMQAGSEKIDLPSDVVDVVGTGGDEAGTVNISTMAAILLAAAGYPVVKHGNRASTSSSGSADVLEALGVQLAAKNDAIIEAFNEVGIAFLFANKFHPSMRHAARVRRVLGFPTAFNVLGPLTNPVAPHASVVGVARKEAAPLVSGVFAERGTNAFVMRGENVGLDELTTVEPSRLWIIQGGEVTEHVVNPAETLGLEEATLGDLVGGGPEDNAAIARSLFEGERGPIFDAVALNAALGIMASDVASGRSAANWHDQAQFNRGLAGAFEVASETLASGVAGDTVERWVEATTE